MKNQEIKIQLESKYSKYALQLGKDVSLKEFGIILES